MKRILSILLCILLLGAILSGCGASTEAADNAYGIIEEGYDGKFEESPVEFDSLTSDSTLNSAVSDSQKLIKTVRLSAETEGFDDLIEGLNQRLTELSGYIQSRETDSYRNRYCSMVIRIPAEALDRFVEHVNTNANVTSFTETAEDVTLKYVDTEAKIAALETEQARLLELLASAESLTDILEIEARLSDVTYELERYASQLRTLANQVDYATVYLTIYEVDVLTPTEDPTVWQRISTGFADTMDDLGEGLTDLFVWIVVNSPYLVIWAIIICLAVVVVRRTARKRKKKQTPPTPPAE